MVMNDTIERILDIIEQSLLRREKGDMFDIEGRSQLQAVVQRFVERNLRLELVLPAFPFKSPSPKKVLGVLPDFGEYYALFVLNSLCETLRSVYEPGARLTIVSDGSIYHDLVGVSKEDFLAYQREVQVMGAQFPHLHFNCIKDMLTEEEYNSWSTDKLAFLEDKLTGFDIDAELEANENLLQVYKGYLIFMELDLEKQLDEMKTTRSQRRKVVKSVARSLIRRGHIFSGLVNRTFANHIRLSIHCHNNIGPKFAVSIAPSKFKTPWHNCVVLKDGKLETMKVSEVSPNARVIKKDGRPWLMVEDDKDLFDWEDGMEVDWDLLLPFGLSLTFKDVPLKSINQQQIRRLGLKFGVVLIRGVQNVPNQEAFEQDVKSFGDIQGWFFGNVLTLKFNPLIDINNVLSKEAMPMHYDGLFKLDENGNSMCPTFQYFFSKYGSGTTLFTDTRLMLEMFDSLKSKKWKVFTPKNSSFGGRPLELDLVQRHPETNEEIIRYHEPWGQEKTQFKPTQVELLTDDSERWNQRLMDCLYNRRFCLHHNWMDGDVLIADNYSLLHTRLAFEDSNREIWRIHLN